MEIATATVVERYVCNGHTAMVVRINDLYDALAVDGHVIMRGVPADIMDAWHHECDVIDGLV